MNKEALIQLVGINKTYQMGSIVVKALNDINLTINKGEYIAILGPSGSGKSTLMNILGCLDTPSSGHYYLNGKDVSYLDRNQKAEVRNQSIGFIFQSFNLLEYGTALDNVTLPLVYRGTPASERKRLAKTILEHVGLGDRIYHHPSELSGGQRQRVAIARALVTDPDILLADEPTGNLDTQSGKSIINMFEKLVQQGKTIIIVTHDMELAKRTQRIIHIRDGNTTRKSHAQPIIIQTGKLHQKRNTDIS